MSYTEITDKVRMEALDCLLTWFLKEEELLDKVFSVCEKNGIEFVNSTRVKGPLFIPKEAKIAILSQLNKLLLETSRMNAVLDYHAVTKGKSECPKKKRT